MHKKRVDENTPRGKKMMQKSGPFQVMPTPPIETEESKKKQGRVPMKQRYAAQRG